MPLDCKHLAKPVMIMYARIEHERDFDQEWYGHPKGLFLLSLTEMAERFSYYGMRAILVLFMVSSDDLHSPNPGLGWDNSRALQVYSTYTMAVYLLSVLGGYLADRYLGQKRAISYGGVLLCLGHIVLAIPNLYSFNLGLLLIIVGVGLLKPNISTLVGRLYPSESDPRRETGFTVFYIGINLGAFAAALVVGYVGERIGFHFGFGLAGVVMICGQLIFTLGKSRYLRDVGNQPRMFTIPRETEHPHADLHEEEEGGGMNPDGTSTRQRAGLIERDRLLVLVIFLAIITLFWAAFGQAGGLMTIFIMSQVDRQVPSFSSNRVEIPVSFFQSINPLCIILFGSLVSRYWLQRGSVKSSPSSLYKVAIGCLWTSGGFGILCIAGLIQTKPSFLWLVLSNFMLTIGELCVSPVALSFITKLAPTRFESQVMGWYFAACGLGNKLAGWIGLSATHTSMSELEDYLRVFAGICIFMLVLGLTIMIFLDRLNGWTHGVEG